MDYKKIHEHILQEHDLFLFEDQIKEIVNIVLELEYSDRGILNYYPLFEYIDKEHELALPKGQLSEIIRVVVEMHNEKPETCTMKTAMQEMFEELYAHSFEIPIGLLAKCEELMAKEKDQIVNAYKEGCSDSILDESTDKLRAEDYYNETYTNPDRV